MRAVTPSLPNDLDVAPHILLLQCDIIQWIKFTVMCLHPAPVAVGEVHTSMEKTVQMFCSGDLDPKRVPQGTECLEPLLAAAPSHLPSRPQRCFTGKNAMHIKYMI